MIRKTFFLLLLFLSVRLFSFAEGFQVKLRSRALLDATVSGYGTEETQGYYRLEDFRFGAKATYGNYSLVADLAYTRGKISLKDVLLSYRFAHGILAVGNTYEPYSLDMLISTADLRFHQSASSVLAFTNSRKLGVTYHLHFPHWYAATGLYTHNDINKIGTDEQVNAWVSTSRLAWRKELPGGWLHFGGAFSFRSREANRESPVRTIASDGVTAMLGSPLLEATLEGVGTEVKGCVELLFIQPKWLVQGEYFLNRFNRTGGAQAYRPDGGYVQGSFLLAGRGFLYEEDLAIPGRPLSERALELTARVNYTQMNDRKAGVAGGREWDLSLGLNYYLNRYFAAKLGGSYVFVGPGCPSFYRKNLFLAQLRLQYVF